ncbi:hypothetical protein ACQEVS_09760 [Streptomyces sp. CA-181903]|uniref:hypothetical protein n=1 Tax=Streptomyces sp. CA-181903 TaxID=3240055 RepID=UPI003D911D0E
MGTSLDAQVQARQMARLLADLDRRLRGLERTSQAAYSSIEGGALEVYDDEGVLRGTVGVQSDGTVGVVVHTAEPPPVPTAPVVQPALAGLTVVWDGQWDDADTTPLDFSRVQIHLGPSQDFTPGPQTLTGSITNTSGGGLTVAVDGYEPTWVRLVAVNTAEVPGKPSAAVQAAARKAAGQDLLDGIVTDLKIAEQAVTGAKVAAGAVGPEALANAAVTTEKIAAAAVTAQHIAAATITGSHLVAGTIQAEQLAADAVAAGKIAADSVTGREIRALAITTDKIAANAVSAGCIQAGAIEATHLKAGAITADKLSLGVNGNLLPDSSFESGYIADRLTGRTDAAVMPTGNRSARALAFTLDATEGRTLEYESYPVTAGERYWTAYDAKAGSDFTTTGPPVQMALQWLGAGGKLLATAAATAEHLAADDAWRRESAVLIAPPEAAACRPVLQVPPGRGVVWFDNVELRAVLSSATGGERAEISPEGLRIYDAEGEEAVCLVGGRPNYLSLAADGSPVATIDQHGNAGFQDLAAAGRLSVGGDDLQTILDRLPRGIVAQSPITTSVSTSGTEMGLMELAFDCDSSRTYRIVLDCYSNPSAVGGELQLRLRDGGEGAPTIRSAQLQSAIHPIAGPNWARVRMELVKQGYELGDGVHRLLTTFNNANGPSGQSMSLFGNEIYPGHMYVEDLGPTLESTGVYNRGGASTKPPSKTYTKVYDATWSGTYANRSSYNSYYGNKMVQGYYSSGTGTQAALAGFGANVASDLAGAKLLSAEVYLYFETWYSNSGGKAVIKSHSHKARPGGFSTDPKAVTVGFAKNEGRWVNITSIFDPSWFRGISLDPNNTSSTYYGRARGVGETNSPRLRLKYVK